MYLQDFEFEISALMIVKPKLKVKLKLDKGAYLCDIDE